MGLIIGFGNYWLGSSGSGTSDTPVTPIQPDDSSSDSSDIEVTTYQAAYFQNGAYLATGYAPQSQNFWCELEFIITYGMYVSNENYDWRGIFGDRDQGNIALYKVGNGGGDEGDEFHYWYKGMDAGETNYDAHMTADYKHKVKIQGDKMYLDGAEVANVSGTFPLAGDLWISGVNCDLGPEETMTMYWLSVKFYEGETLVRNYVPVENGMYDTVTEETLTPENGTVTGQNLVKIVAKSEGFGDVGISSSSSGSSGSDTVQKYWREDDGQLSISNEPISGYEFDHWIIVFKYADGHQTSMDFSQSSWSTENIFNEDWYTDDGSNLVEITWTLQCHEAQGGDSSSDSGEEEETTYPYSLEWNFSDGLTWEGNGDNNGEGGETCIGSTNGDSLVIHTPAFNLAEDSDIAVDVYWGYNDDWPNTMQVQLYEADNESAQNNREFTISSIGQWNPADNHTRLVFEGYWARDYKCKVSGITKNGVYWGDFGTIKISANSQLTALSDSGDDSSSDSPEEECSVEFNVAAADNPEATVNVTIGSDEYVTSGDCWTIGANEYTKIDPYSNVPDGYEYSYWDIERWYADGSSNSETFCGVWDSTDITGQPWYYNNGSRLTNIFWVAIYNQVDSGNDNQNTVSVSVGGGSMIGIDATTTGGDVIASDSENAYFSIYSNEGFTIGANNNEYFEFYSWQLTLVYDDGNETTLDYVNDETLGNASLEVITLSDTNWYYEWGDTTDPVLVSMTFTALCNDVEQEPEPECQHENFHYEDKDDSEHSIICNDCGANIGDEEHEYDNGTCVKCGYCCRHENYHYEDVTSDDLYHNVICDVCGTNFATEEHDYDENGVCTKCGHVAME